MAEEAEEAAPAYRLRSARRRDPPTPFRMEDEEEDGRPRRRRPDSASSSEDDSSPTRHQTTSKRSNGRTHLQAGHTRILGIANDSELTRPSIRRSPRIEGAAAKEEDESESKSEVKNTVYNYQTTQRYHSTKESQTSVQKQYGLDQKTTLRARIPNEAEPQVQASILKKHSEAVNKSLHTSKNGVLGLTT